MGRGVIKVIKVMKVIMGRGVIKVIKVIKVSGVREFSGMGTLPLPLGSPLGSPFGVSLDPFLGSPPNLWGPPGALWGHFWGSTSHLFPGAPLLGSP